VKILLVCTGNTCRSPMAQAMLAHLLAVRGKRDIAVESAGVMAFPGMHASPQAVRVMHERGFDISGHRSRLLTPDLLGDADLVLCMSDDIARAVRAMGGDTRAKPLSVYTAGHGGNIEDPFGKEINAYRACAAQLYGILTQVAQDI
jgi:protein-tyrosine-phosphatase